MKSRRMFGKKSTKKEKKKKESDDWAKGVDVF